MKKWIQSITLVALMILAMGLMTDSFAQNSQGRTSRVLPQGAPDTNPTDSRVTKYGDVSISIVGDGKHGLSDEGSYYVTTSVVGTAVAMAGTITTFAETAGRVGATLYIKNTEPIGGKRIYMDYIKLLCAAVPTAATSLQYALVLDSNAVRYTSGGTNFVPVPANGDSSIASSALIYFGDLTTAVPNNRRTVGRGTLRGVIPTVYDVLTILCGGDGGGGSMATAAASGRQVDVTTPVIIGPQQNLVLTLWGASYAGTATWEFELGHWER
jgi:hypothetical protein